MKTIHEPRGPKKKLFAISQDTCRNDVERAFRVLQSRFAMMAGPIHFWDKNELRDIMTTCIIIHNMIVEDERDVNAPIQDCVEAPTINIEYVDDNIRFQQFLSRHQ